MGTLVAVQYIDAIYLAGDTKPVVLVNKETNEERHTSQLFYTVDDMTIVLVGNKFAIENIMIDYMVNPTRNVQLLRELMINYYLDWVKCNKDKSYQGIVEAAVATFEDGISVIYFISPDRGYELVRSIAKERERIVWTVGAATSLASDTTMTWLDGGASLDELFFTSLFTTLIDHGAGGMLNVHLIDPHGTCLYLRTPLYEHIYEANKKANRI
jgi:hypothetical protein